jgi:histidine triad (HIT) family protein
MDCLFCKIVQKEIPAEIILETPSLLVFNDIYPKAPIHKLIIPKKHIPTLNDIEEEDLSLFGDIVKTAVTIAQSLNIAENGYRLVNNCNAGGGQTVFHIHFHLLAGRDFDWPPG